MPEGYLHLTCEQRCQIYALLQSGHSQAHIARQIGVDPSTISCELVRNTGARGYRFKQAHEKASQRREEASDKPRKMTPDLVELIEEKLTGTSIYRVNRALADEIAVFRTVIPI